MDNALINQLVVDLLTVLVAGLLSGALCKRLGMSLLVGYLIVGALIGEGGLRFVSQENHELEYLASGGALLLLFSVGIEFSLGELLRMLRYFILGGAVQMLLVSVPLLLVGYAYGLPWNAIILAASAAALSSTVLVFKSLAEWGQSATPHGRRAIGILLFQDVALLPLMLLVPLLTGQEGPPSPGVFALLGIKSLLFVVLIIVARRGIARWAVPVVAYCKSVELVVLLSLSILGGACYGAHLLGFPPAIGALGAGLILSGNRLSQQIDTVILPFREAFAAVFFVTLGTLLHPLAFFDEPLLLSTGIIGMLLLKASAAAVALRLTGLDWRAAAGMGLGLAQLGEFSFLLIAEGLSEGVLEPIDYNRMLFIALGTLILTPQLLKLGLRWTGDMPNEPSTPSYPTREDITEEKEEKAVVIGMGPIGRQIASRIETLGVEVCLVDRSPINLYSFSQQGFHTIAGDARDPEILLRADVSHCQLAVVCVPHDDTAKQIVQTLRSINPTAFILVRCRYQSNAQEIRQRGGDSVISEEQEASGALLRQCDKVLL